MKDRTIVCPCEDVELEAIEEAVERGYTGLEEVKRLTAATTGPCQGKWCLETTIRVLADLTGRDPESFGGITHRQPVRGVPLAVLARHPEADPASETPDDDTAGGDDAQQTDASGGEEAA